VEAYADVLNRDPQASEVDPLLGGHDEPGPASIPVAPGPGDPTEAIAETKALAKQALGREVEVGDVCLTLPARTGRVQIWFRPKRRWWHIW